MKNNLLKTLFLLFVLLLSKRSFSQENSYFENNPIWKLNSTCSVGGFCIQAELYNYYTAGDTLIDSLQYIQIFKKAQGTFTWNAGGSNMGCQGSYVFFNPIPTCFIRSFDKQMFVRFPSDTIEQLLYEFNLNVGDTLPLTYNNYFKDITVAAIDSIYTPYGYRQRFTLAGSTWAQYLIEGIGHSRGLIEPLKVPLECTYILNCYGLNDSSYFPSIGAGCNVAIGIKEDANKISLSVFPNPFKNTTTLEFDAAYKNADLKVYTLCGQEVKAKQSILAGKIILERGNLDAGIYFFELRLQDNLKTVGKLLIED